MASLMELLWAERARTHNVWDASVENLGKGCIGHCTCGWSTGWMRSYFRAREALEAHFDSIANERLP